MQELRVILDCGARAPVRKSPGAVGYDLYAHETVEIPRGGRAVVRTGIIVAVPDGTYGRIAARSGLAWEKGFMVGAGVIDADYRGEVKVLLFNFGDKACTVAKGERIAQLILERAQTPAVLIVERLDDTPRGAGGFGSTGK